MNETRKTMLEIAMKNGLTREEAQEEINDFMKRYLPEFLQEEESK